MNSWPLWSLILLLGAAPVAVNAAVCGVKQVPRPIEILATESHYVWDLEENPRLWRSKGDSATETTLHEFRLWVDQFAPTNKLELLKLQRQAAFESGMSRMVRRHDLLLRGTVGSISPASCLEKYIFGMHLQKFSPSVFPAEFSAFVFRSKKKAGWLRIYFSFGDGRTFESTPEWDQRFRDTMLTSPPQNPRVLTRIYKDMAKLKAWDFKVLIHSHPFMINFPQPHVGGTVLPSDEDIKGWVYLSKNLKMKSAWITNGLDSIRVESNQFGLLERTL